MAAPQVLEALRYVDLPPLIGGVLPPDLLVIWKDADGKNYSVTYADFLAGVQAGVEIEIDLGLGDLNNVTIASVVANQVLTYNSLTTRWENKTLTVGMIQGLQGILDTYIYSSTPLPTPNTNARRDADGASGFQAVDFDVVEETPTDLGATFKTGRVRWNRSLGTIEVDSDIDTVTFEVGQKSVTRVINTSGATILKGSVVRISGSNSILPTVALAQASDLANSQGLVGIMLADVLDAEVSFACTQGVVEGLDLSAFAEGDFVYLSGTVLGQISTTPGAMVAQLGVVINNDPVDGVILLNVQQPLDPAFIGAEPAIPLGSTIQYWRGDKTWQDFGVDVRATTLTGFFVGSNTPIVAADDIITAFGKVQGQINNIYDVGRGLSLDSAGKIQLGNLDFGDSMYIDARTYDEQVFGLISSVELTPSALFYLNMDRGDADSAGGFFAEIFDFTTSLGSGFTINKSFAADEYEMKFYKYAPLGTQELVFTYDNAIRLLDPQNNKGMEYGGDYEANFTARSLITRQFLEAEIAALSIGDYVQKAGDTMTGNLLFEAPAGVDSTASSGVLNLGTSNADIINIGWSGAVINMQGTVLNQNVDNLAVEDKLIRLNVGGSAASGVSSGFEIEEGGVITGYFATDATRTGWDFKAPASQALTFGLDLLTAARLLKAPDASGTIALTSDITTALLGYVPTTRTIEINGVVQDLSANRVWTLTTSNVAEGSNLYFTETRVRASLLTGFVAGSNTAIVAADSVLQAFQKVQGQISARPSGSGANTQVAYWTGVGTQSGDNEFTYNSTTNVLSFQRGSVQQSSLFSASSFNLRANQFNFLVLSALDNTTGTEFPILVSAGNGIDLYTANSLRWSITAAGILQSTGAQTIQSSTGSITIATAAGNGNILFNAHGTGRVRISSTIDNAVGNFATYSATGVFQQRTAAQVLSDIGAQASGSYITRTFNVVDTLQTLALGDAFDLDTLKTGGAFVGTAALNRPFGTNAVVMSFVSSNNYGYQLSGRLNVFGIRSLENGTWASWRTIITDADSQTITGQKTFTPAQIFVGEIQSKASFGNLSFGMFEGNTTTRTWGIYNVNADHDFGLIRYGGAGNKLMFSIDRTTDAGYFNGKFTFGGTTLLPQVNLYSIGSISGAVNSFGILATNTVQSDVTNSARIFQTSTGTQAATFTLPALYHFLAAQGTFGAGSTVTNQYGFFADSTLIGATNNIGFYGNLAASTGRWNIYMAGTANNYLAGNLLINTTSDSGDKLRVNGTARFDSVTNATGDFVRIDVNNVLRRRTAAETLADIGAQPAGAYGLSSADITNAVFSTSQLTLTRASGDITATVPTWNQNTTGSAATLTTPRTLTIGSTGKAFDGSADVSWSLAEIGISGAYVLKTGDTMSGALTVTNGTASVGVNLGTLTLNTGEDGTAASLMVNFKNINGGGLEIEKRGGMKVIARGDSTTGIYIFQGHRSTGEVMRIDGNGTYDTEGGIISKWARFYDSSEEVITAGGTTTINPSTTPAKNYTLEANRTIQFSTGYSSALSFSAVIRFKQDAVGGRVITWSGSGQQVRWQGGIAPIISDLPNEVTFITLYWDGVDLYGYKTCGF